MTSECTTWPSADYFSSLQSSLAAGQIDPPQLRAAREHLLHLGDSARQASQPEVAGCAELLAGLVEIMLCSDDSSDALAGSIRAGFVALEAAISGPDDTPTTVRDFLDHAQLEWGDYLELLKAEDAGGSADSTLWEDVPGQPADDDVPPSSSTGDPSHIGMILSALGGSDHAMPDDAAEHGKRVDPSADDSDEPFANSGNRVSADDLRPPTPEHVEMDDELRAAFLDDAGRCLTSIEDAVMQAEANSNGPDGLRQICRDLHTLKGAAASVGYARLAEYLHRVEDFVGHLQSTGGTPNLEPVLGAVDAVRAQLTPASREDCPMPSNNAANSPAGVSLASRASDSVRVKASQLDRLLDLLAELVILRNRRDRRVDQLQQLHAELNQCVTRLRLHADEFGVIPPVPCGSTLPRRDVETLASPHGPEVRQTNYVREIADDLAEATRSARHVSHVLADEVSQLSQFIRNFRQELLELRRLPIGGLLQRLQRTARDAARAEKKSIHINLIGEHVGLEAHLQEQLFEPLLHLVRNAVSHGIESEAERRQSGKAPIGNVTLSAETTAGILTIEIRDDGAGLNYDAIRRRGLERGLIAPGLVPTDEELARLIFHAGFSTRDAAGAVAGRGVGMDAVTAGIEKLRGSVHVESRPGRGTTFRVDVPLPAMIEHALIVRAARQYFALPMQALGAGGTDFTAAADSIPDDVGYLSHILGLSTEEPRNAGRVITLGPPDSRVRIFVDEIVGSEEVVRRPLPKLISGHPCFSGVTFSAGGRTVLLLDHRRLVEEVSHRVATAAEPTAAASPDGVSRRRRVLIADDSLSARRSLLRHLEALKLQVTEAEDGLAALEILRAGESFDLIVSDLEMPRLNGLQFLHELLRNEQWRRIPVAVVSSCADENIRRRAAELGAHAVVRKPISRTDLRALCDEVFTAADVTTAPTPPQMTTSISSQ